MTKQIHGQVPAPDHSRIRRATQPRLRQPIPAINHAVENANVVLNKVALTVNRAGSNPSNPILAGLAANIEVNLGIHDSLRGVFLYQDLPTPGPNLRAQATSFGPGIYGLEFVAGQGQTITGDQTIGAQKNFLRVKSAFGSFEREFWVKDYDPDVVAVNGQQALDTITLEPVAIDVPQVSSGAPLVQANIDFMVSWNDEFQALHNAENQYLDPGFLKSYGGAAFVSLFQTGMGEGSGTEVVAVTQQPIMDMHTLELQNTGGLKHVTARFRSKLDSASYVDVPFLCNVIPLPTCPECPDTECPCTEGVVFEESLIANVEDEFNPGIWNGELDLSVYAATDYFGPAVDGEYRVWRFLLVSMDPEFYVDLEPDVVSIMDGFIDDDGTMHVTHYNLDLIGFVFSIEFSEGSEWKMFTFAQSENQTFDFRMEKGCATWPNTPDVIPIEVIGGGA